VIPVRMQEAWLLHDEPALRLAAGCPAGTVALNLPALHRVESVPDPRGTLYEALKRASQSRGRKLRKFRPIVAAHRLADLIEDWSPLCELPAYQRLEDHTRKQLRAMGVPVCSVD
jgi:hypothetical protein